MLNNTNPESLPKDYYQDWLKRNFNGNKTRGTKKDFDTVRKVRDRFHEMKTARQNSCYWSSYNEVNSGSATSGGDWNARWDMQDKAKLMWSLYGAFANSQSNVKSPMGMGRVNAFINQCKKINLAYDALPNNPEDRNIANFASEALNYVERTTSSKQQRLMAYEDAATHGSGFWREAYIRTERKYRYPKTKDLTEEENESYKNKDIVYGEPETKCIVDTPMSIYVPIRELYWDPSARTDHGPAYAAADVIWRRIIPLEAAKELLRGIPNAKNIDKIESTRTYIHNDDYSGFFEPPTDTISGNYVEWLEYENTVKDEYSIVVNDMICVDTPLPTTHKEITFQKVDYKVKTGQFYGKGIMDEILMIQGAEEVITNMATDYVFNSYRYRAIVASSASGEITEDALSGDNALIVVDDDEGRADIRNKFQQIVNSPIGFDLFRLFDIYERQATIATGIDPSQLSLLPQGRTATATLANKEQIEATFGGVIENFINGGLSSGGRQRWELMMQNWKLPRFKDILGMGKDSKKVPNRTIRLEGMELKLNSDSDDLELSTSNKKFSFFEIEGEYLKPTDTIDIIIKPDIKDIESRAYEQQQVQEELPQLAPFMVDPQNQQQMASHPYPYINGPKWFAERYAPIMKMSTDLLITGEHNSELAIKKAEKDVTKILNGEQVAGMPGSSAAHNKYEAQVLFAIQAKIAELEDEVVSDMDRQAKQLEGEMQGMLPFDPMTGQPLSIPEPIPNAEKVDKIERMRDTWTRLSKHLAQDSLPAGLIEEAAMEGLQQPEQAPAPMSPDVPMAPMQGGGMGGTAQVDPNMQMQGMPNSLPNPMM